jgi:dsDNA-binding SOS-regulon protein
MSREIINLSKKDCEIFFKRMTDRIEYLGEMLNNSTAYSEGETRERLKMMEERKYLELLLYKDLNVQSYEYYKKDVRFQID